MKAAEYLLWPASLVYGAAARLRSWSYEAGWFRPRRLDSIVVSVGNLTTGGTGKTPMIIWLAERFMQNGERVGILSRGYRSLPQNHVAAGSAFESHFNDEMALLHGRFGANAEYGIDANRFRAAKRLEARGVGCFILDDGFQHLQLARDVNIVMIDASRPFGAGRLLPMGRLREPLSALRRADIVVVHRCAECSPEIEERIRRHTRAPIFLSKTELLDLRAWPANSSQQVCAKGKKFFAFCGIGNPSGFFADLNAWHIEVAGQRSFRDHHRYNKKDMASLETAARKAGADALICTEKDIFDLPKSTTIQLPLYFCRIGMRFNDEEGLWQSILRQIERKKPERKA